MLRTNNNNCSGLPVGLSPCFNVSPVCHNNSADDDVAHGGVDSVVDIASNEQGSRCSERERPNVHDEGITHSKSELDETSRANFILVPTEVVGKRDTGSTATPAEHQLATQQYFVSTSTNSPKTAWSVTQNDEPPFSSSRSTAASDMTHSPPSTPIGSVARTNSVLLLHDEDVLSGTGKFTNRHAGNQHFRQLCADVRPATFRSLSNHAKRELAQRIVHAIERGRGGRFLKEGPKHQHHPSCSMDTDSDSDPSTSHGRRNNGWIELSPDEKILRTLLVLRRRRQTTAIAAPILSPLVPTDDANNTPPLCTVECHDTDVLSGTGKFTNRHPGNRYFRQLCIKCRPPSFRTLTKQAKRNLASSIISAIEERRGRFLGQKPATTNDPHQHEQVEWVELTMEEKIRRTLLVLQRLNGTAEKVECSLETDIRVHDVLSGSGSFTNRHPGNQYFRQLCVEHRPKLYRGQSPQVKRDVALTIIAAVEKREPPGRFLCHKDGPEWIELGDDEKLEKTLEALKYVEKRKRTDHNNDTKDNSSATTSMTRRSAT